MFCALLRKIQQLPPVIEERGITEQVPSGYNRLRLHSWIHLGW